MNQPRVIRRELLAGTRLWQLYEQRKHAVAHSTARHVAYIDTLIAQRIERVGASP